MFKVYWTDFTNTPQGIYTNTLNRALQISEEKRREGFTFVTMVGENPNSIGKPGVDSVVDGKLPDGLDYTWMKRRQQ
jgi:topoisomerase IA-like protein